MAQVMGPLGILPLGPLRSLLRGLLASLTRPAPAEAVANSEEWTLRWGVDGNLEGISIHRLAHDAPNPTRGEPDAPSQ